MTLFTNKSHLNFSMGKIRFESMSWLLSKKDKTLFKQMSPAPWCNLKKCHQIKRCRTVSNWFWVEKAAVIFWQTKARQRNIDRLSSGSKPRRGFSCSLWSISYSFLLKPLYLRIICSSTFSVENQTLDSNPMITGVARLAVMAVGHVMLSWQQCMLGCHGSRACWAVMAVVHAGAEITVVHAGLSC